MRLSSHTSPPKPDTLLIFPLVQVLRHCIRHYFQLTITGLNYHNHNISLGHKKLSKAQQQQKRTEAKVILFFSLSQLHSHASSMTKRRPLLPIPRRSTLYKACGIVLSIPESLKRDKQVCHYLTDLLAHLVVSWVVSAGVYNPLIEFNPQQKASWISSRKPLLPPQPPP